jgi:hypothetical protein
MNLISILQGIDWGTLLMALGFAGQIAVIFWMWLDDGD